MIETKGVRGSQETVPQTEINKYGTVYVRSNIKKVQRNIGTEEEPQMIDEWEYDEVQMDMVEHAIYTASDTVALDNKDLYPEWEYGAKYIIGQIVRYEDKLYKCYTNPGDNLYPPSQVPAIWKIVQPNVEWPDWVQPLGAGTEYNKGDKVTHKGLKWISDVDNNVWEPGVYGWTEYKE